MNFIFTPVHSQHCGFGTNFSVFDISFRIDSIEDNRGSGWKIMMEYFYEIKFSEYKFYFIFFKITYSKKYMLCISDNWLEKKNKNNNFQIIHGCFLPILSYILVKFKYRYQLTKLFKYIWLIHNVSRKVWYPRANRKTMRSKRLHANRKQLYVLKCEGIYLM